MVTRTSSRQVVFRRPFVLSGLNALQPAGTYVVDTEEEQLDTPTVLAWRRIATVVQLKQGDTTEYLSVDPSELHEALMRDGAQPDDSTPSPNSPGSRLRRARGTMNALKIRRAELRTAS